MRPDPDHKFGDSADSGRIIYLGDVRRRKATRGQSLPDRHYLVAVVVVAGIGWAVWLTVLFTVPPSRLLTYLAFFVPLSVGLGATAALIEYAVEYRMAPVASVPRSIRRGSVLSIGAVGNLTLLAAHRWSLPALAVTLVVTLLVELFFEHRST